MMTKYLEILSIVLTTSFSVNGITDSESEKVLLEIAPIVSTCIREHAITADQIKMAKNDEGELESCFLACIFKGNGLMNEEGELDKMVSLLSLNNVLSNAGSIDTAMAIIEDCEKVNNVTVSDGHAGCERAKLLFNCLYSQKHNEFNSIRDKILNLF